MGITGLIPFCQAATKPSVIQEFRGSRVAIDSYWLLHKGSYGCADKLIKGIKTTLHIDFCLKYVNMLLSLGIQPIMVFDGRNLPAKAGTEAKRRKDRDAAKEKAKEFLRQGKTEEARKEFTKGVDITHEHAIALMNECRKMGVDCVVGMYEADAQLAYLNKIGVAEYVISEDSDLILFGCQKIIFKLQLDGSCLLFEASKLHLALDVSEEKFDFEKFRRICILSGCDYLDSLYGIGLAKARKFMMMTEETNMRRALLKIPSYLNMKKLEITDEYIDGFLKAEATFKHMFVYDPLKREMLRLNPLEPDTEIESCSNAGELMEPSTAYQLALGNLNPRSLKRMENFNPDFAPPAKKMSKFASIWRRSGLGEEVAKLNCKIKQQSNISNFFNKSAAVRQIAEQENDVTSEMEIDDLVTSYCVSEVVTPKRRTADFEESPKQSSNPFAKRHQAETAIEPANKPSLLERLSKNEIKLEMPVVQENHKVISRFFAKKEELSTTCPVRSSIKIETQMTEAEIERKAKYDAFYEAMEVGRESEECSQLTPQTEETIIESEDMEEVPETVDLESYKFKPKKQTTLTNDLRSDPPKLKMKFRGPGLSRTKTSQKLVSSSMQMKLSEFGFQRKPTM